MMNAVLNKAYHNFFVKEVNIYPLITFRIIFGVLMLFSTIRFLSNGWVEAFYIKPQFFFSYYGFEWVKPYSPELIYGLFAALLFSSLGIVLGWFYRFSVTVFFLSFTYIELCDKTYYLNHYYFVSLCGFLLIFLPANRFFSLDAFFGRVNVTTHISAVYVNILKFQLACVYFFAGIAKINEDWLFKALPLNIWLPAKSHFPFVGFLLDRIEVAYAFSWAGMLFDIFIILFMLNRFTRIWAYLAIIFFHIITWWLFPIGVFPWVMIFSMLIFFQDSFHKNLLILFSFGKLNFIKSVNYVASSKVKLFMYCFIIWQVVMPFRYLLYRGNLFWTEQGFRFSWRVMLMEKSGIVFFKLKSNGKEFLVDNKDYLTKAQEKMMATQPDMVLQFAHYLKNIYQSKGFNNVEVYAESYVSLNGRPSQLYIDPNVNLAKQEDNFKPKSWILPFKD